MDTLKGLLGDNADEKISNIMNVIHAGDSSDSPPEPPTELSKSPENQPELPINPELFMQAQQLMNQISSSSSDSRAALLHSLKPFMRSSRKNTIDSAIRMLNLAQLSQYFKGWI